MDDVRLAILGDKAAQERLTERGEMLPCAHCNSINKEGKRVVLERVIEEPCRDVEDADHDD